MPNDDSTVRPRTGAWVALVNHNHLLTVQLDYSPHVPELPGGGVDYGETLLQGALRECKEEAEIDLSGQNYKVIAEHKQFVHFYADDIDEYWDYDQTYFLIQCEGHSLYHDNLVKVEEGHRSWFKISDIDWGAMHYFHSMAIQKLLTTG